MEVNEKVRISLMHMHGFIMLVGTMANQWPHHGYCNSEAAA